MRTPLYVLPFLLVALVACGKKDTAADTTTSADTKTESTTTQTPPKSDGASTDTSDLKAKVVGEWQMSSEQGPTKVEGDISIHEDGTFSNAGTVMSETPGEDGTVKMTIAYKIEGKWSLNGQMLETTPDSVETHVEDIEITAKDPANQAAVDAQKEEMKKKAEQQSKDSLNKPSSSKVEEATADTMTLSMGEAKVVYNRKK